jgi:hypothetical protein
MADKTTYWRDAVLNAMRNQTVTGFNAYVSLHTADPGNTGASEVTGGSYARQLAGFGAPADDSGVRAIVNAADVDFTGMPAATVTHFAIWDSATSGNPLYKEALAAARTTLAGDTIRFTTSSLKVTEA